MFHDAPFIKQGPIGSVRRKNFNMCKGAVNGLYFLWVIQCVIYGPKGHEVCMKPLFPERGRLACIRQFDMSFSFGTQIFGYGKNATTKSGKATVSAK